MGKKYLFYKKKTSFILNKQQHLPEDKSLLLWCLYLDGRRDPENTLRNWQLNKIKIIKIFIVLCISKYYILQRLKFYWHNQAPSCTLVAWNVFFFPNLVLHLAGPKSLKICVSSKKGPTYNIQNHVKNHKILCLNSLVW